jgi:hypothetical protein
MWPSRRAAQVGVRHEPDLPSGSGYELGLRVDLANRLMRWYTRANRFLLRCRLGAVLRLWSSLRRKFAITSLASTARAHGVWMIAHACRVHRSHIRAGADELAYALHIIVLRFGREWALIAAELTVADPMLGTKARTGHHGLRPDTSTASQAG